MVHGLHPSCVIAVIGSARGNMDNSAGKQSAFLSHFYMFIIRSDVFATWPVNDVYTHVHFFW
jgi:hypothetical protein